jgi:hypothetical protein
MQMLGGGQGAQGQEIGGGDVFPGNDFSKPEPHQDAPGNDQGADELPF